MSKSVCKFLAVLFIAVGSLEASSQKTIDDILPLLEAFSSEKVSEKAIRIKSILETVKALNLMSPYRCSRIFNILDNDLYDGVDYSAKALQTEGKFGYGLDPIGMTTVHSRLNEVMDLIVRSALIDDIGNPTDSAMETNGTIWSRLNYLFEQSDTDLQSTLGTKDELSLGDGKISTLTISSFLNFIRTQCVSLAGLFDKEMLFGKNLSEKPNPDNSEEPNLTDPSDTEGTQDPDTQGETPDNSATDQEAVQNPDEKGLCLLIKEIQTNLNDCDVSNVEGAKTNLSKSFENLTGMYQILLHKVQESIPNSLSISLTVNQAKEPVLKEYSLAEQYQSMYDVLQSQTGDVAIDIGKISRIAGYIWPKIVENISEADEEKAQYWVGTFVQPGLTLMDCLNHIRQIVFENNIEATTETNLKKQVELYPSIGLINNSGDPLLKSGPLAKTSLHAAIKSLAEAVPDDQKQEPFKTFFADSDLDEGSIYNYNGLISCLLYPNLYPNGYKELFSEPLLQAFGYEEAQSTPWFLINNETATQHYIRKMLIDCSEFMSDQNGALYASLKEQFPVTDNFYATMEPYFQLMKKSLSNITPDIDSVEYSDPYDVAKTKEYPVDFCKVLEKGKKAEEISIAYVAKKTELQPYEANKDTIEQFAVLAKNFEDACSAYDSDKTEIKKSLVSAQYTELKNFDALAKVTENTEVSDYKYQLSNYLSVADDYIENLETSSKLADQAEFHDAEKAFLSDLYTKEAELDFLLGSSNDHPADITLYGYLNGLLFECGAQLLINYIGTPCDCGDNNGTLYAKLRFHENEALCNDLLNNEGNNADLIEESANKIRTAFGNLIGTIRYKYKNLICHQPNFQTVLTQLSELRSDQWTLTAENLTETAEGFVTIIENLAASLLT